MKNFTHELNYLADYFKRVQAREQPLFSWLYLTPQARIERLRELMMPVSKGKR